MTQTKMKLAALLIALTAVPGLPVWAAAPEAQHSNPPQKDPVLELARLRSEGVAHFESGVGLKKALAAFEAAIKIKPDSAIELHNLGTTQRKQGNMPVAKDLLTRAMQADKQFAHPAYTLGLIHRGAGETGAALPAFEEARRRAPGEPSIHYQLGRLYREMQREPEALQSFIDALQLDPQHTGAMYQLFLYYQGHGEADRAKAMFEEFSRVKRALSATRKELNDDETALARPVVAATAASLPQRSVPSLTFKTTKIAVSQASSFDVRDFDSDGLEDLLVGGRDGTVRVLRNEGQQRFTESAVYKVDDGTQIQALYGEVLVRGEGFRLVAVTRSGVYVSQQDIGKPAGDSAKRGFTEAGSVEKPGDVAFADLDHDGDLDLIVDSFEQVLMNDGNAAFAPADYLAADAAKAVAKTAGPLIAVDVLDRNAVDFVLHAAGGERVLLADALGGRHAAQPFTKLERIRSVREADAADLDNDGRSDLIAAGAEGVEIGYHQDRYKFAAQPLAGKEPAPTDVLIGDFDNDGWKDLLAFSDGTSLQWWRNGGERKFQPQPLQAALGGAPLGRSIAADIEGDGRLDAVVLLKSGAIELLTNASQGIGQATRVALTGIRSAPSSLHTIVEVRRGNFYQKYVSTGRTLHLPLGEGNYAEIVRINWPNGFIESKLKIDAAQRSAFKESERVSGSCPSIFAWDGGSFRFVTDAFISGPMGVPMGPGKYFPVDHDEYLKIPGSMLRSVDGKLYVAITEELREAVFLDRVRLIAVDRPAGTELYPNEYLLAGDFPQFKLHLTRSAQPPARAQDLNGRDVTDLVRTADWRYPHGFRRLQYEGLAEQNGVEFELPAGAAKAKQLRVFFTGWFHYFESTSLVAASQRKDLSVDWPRIEAWHDGAWREVMTIGIPSGKDKTVVVDLAGRLPADARRLRVRTNLALYWDRIAIDVAEPPTEVITRQIGMSTARLRFKGFSSFQSANLSKVGLQQEQGAMPQPERFVYNAMRFAAPWNPLIGRYTRYGAVDELLGQVDSLMTVFGSGDELLLEFDDSALPPPRAGWERDYLLHLEGFVKDGDKYTAHAGTLEPIPYAGMPGYPYANAADAQRIFDTPAYRDYLARYQTRVPLRFTGPVLAPDPAAPPPLGASLDPAVRAPL